MFTEVAEDLSLSGPSSTLSIDENVDEVKENSAGKSSTKIADNLKRLVNDADCLTRSKRDEFS